MVRKKLLARLYSLRHDSLVELDSRGVSVVSSASNPNPKALSNEKIVEFHKN